MLLAGILLITTASADQDSASGFRAKTGTFVSDSCVSMMIELRKQKGIDDSVAAARNSIDELLAKALDKVKACGQRYPELRKYLDQWQVRFSEVPIACETKPKGLPENFVAYYNRPEKTVFLRPSIFRLWLHSDPMVNMMEVDKIIHEYLHTTKADNQITHNSLQSTSIRVPSTPWGMSARLLASCETTSLNDRIVLISSLCSDVGIETDTRASIALFERIKNCGFQRGCINTFTETGSNLASNDLSTEDATRLCLHIYEKGACDYIKHSYYPQLGTDFDCKAQGITPEVATEALLRRVLGQWLPPIVEELKSLSSPNSCSP